tara:strand:+ start:26609 stop:27454 length:846 start_codon:yes stop_codon:yes gene_type:complete
MTVKIIAEIGANHNGDMSLAKEMIRAAAENGADYAKFQSWQAAKIGAGPWDDNEPFFQFKNKRDFYNNAQLTNENHYELIEECNAAGVKFLTTCFDRERVEFLSSLGISDIKVASCDSTSKTMIDELSSNFGRLVVSTGMTTIDEIMLLRDQLDSKNQEYALLHCVSMYPTPLEKISLDRLVSIGNCVGEIGEFGISDHSLGTTFPKVAVTMGATWIEKHFTTDRNIPGPDNHMSIIPSELLEIRRFCEEFSLLGKDSQAETYQEELDLRKIIQKRFGDNC